MKVLSSLTARRLMLAMVLTILVSGVSFAQDPTDITGTVVSGAVTAASGKILGLVAVSIPAVLLIWGALRGVRVVMGLGNKVAR